MKLRRVVGTTGLAPAMVSAGPRPVQPQQTAEELYQAGLYQEEVQGTLEQALAIFERILREFPQSRAVGAQAQLHIGLCYETRGRTEAQSAYERVIRDYADQPEVVARARARLAALVPAPVEGREPVARRLLSGEDTGQQNLVMTSPSPDGRHLLFVDLQLEGLYQKDLESEVEEELVPGLPASFILGPVWAPDGSRVAYADVSFANSLTSLKILDLASRQVVTIDDTEAPYSGGQAQGMYSLDWPRDGSSLPFAASGLGILPVSGGELIFLAEQFANNQAATFSPDGRYVAYAAGPEGEERIFVQTVSGGTRRRITDGQGGNGSPVWSPDGTAIAYQRTDGVWLVPISGGEGAGAPRLAFANTANKFLVAWPESGGLYLTLYNEDRVPYQIPMDPADGAPRGAAESLPNRPGMVRTFAWSPDQTRIAFVEGWLEADAEIAILGANGTTATSYRIPEEGERTPLLWWIADGQNLTYRSNLGVSLR